MPSRRYPARIGEARSNIRNPYATHECVEDECLLLVQCIRLNVAKEDLRSIGEK